MPGRRFHAAALALLVALGLAAPAVAGFAGGPLSLRTMDGHSYTLADLGGRPTVIVFWAPWCSMCHAQLPKLHDLYERAKAQGLQMIAVGFADDEEAVRAYVADHAATFSFPVYYDPDDRAAKHMQVMGTPTIYLYDRRGRLVRATWLSDDPAFQRDVAALLSP